jgi:ABC-type nitrate/sulfonate/bicarbonate transport system substrate-binding protein
LGFALTRRGCLAAAACFAAARAASAKPLREVTCGLASKSLISAAPRIAKEMGFFERQGIDPKFTYLDSANAATAALISRSVEVAMSGSSDAIAAQARGQKVVVIVSTYAGLSGSLVLSRNVTERLGVLPTAPVNDRLKALNALTIASTSAAPSFTITYRTAAKAAGATVRFTYMALPAMVAALETGAIQGYIATAPYWAIPVLKGSGVMWISAPKGELPPEYCPVSPANLQVMRDFADANPTLVKGIVAAMTEYIEAIDQRPVQVEAAMAKLFPEIDAKTLDLLFAVESQPGRPNHLRPQTWLTTSRT